MKIKDYIKKYTNSKFIEFKIIKNKNNILKQYNNPFIFILKKRYEIVIIDLNNINTDFYTKEDYILNLINFIKEDNKLYYYYNIIDNIRKKLINLDFNSFNNNHYYKYYNKLNMFLNIINN